MSSSSRLSYNQRADNHWHPVAKRLLKIADSKKTNLIISADLSTTTELLECADRKIYESSYRLSELTDCKVSALILLCSKPTLTLSEISVNKQFKDLNQSHRNTTFSSSRIVNLLT